MQPPAPEGSELRASAADEVALVRCAGPCALPPGIRCRSSWTRMEGFAGRGSARGRRLIRGCGQEALLAPRAVCKALLLPFHTCGTLPCPWSGHAAHRQLTHRPLGQINPIGRHQLAGSCTSVELRRWESSVLGV